MKKREILIPVLMTGILSSIIYLYFGLFPYGELTLAWCDARQQVVPLLMDLKDMISGEQSIFLNLQNAGGIYGACCSFLWRVHCIFWWR